MKADYKADLAGTNRELADLLKQREQLEIKIAKTRYRIAALMALTEDNEEIDQAVGITLGGLTDACRTAFQSTHPTGLSAIGVKERLLALGFPIDHYKNGMAAVHTVISRLFEAREIVPEKTENGETGFKWNGMGRNIVYERATGYPKKK